MSPKTKAPPHADIAAKEPNHRHQAFASWLETSTGQDVDVKTVQLVLSLTKQFRASPDYAAVKDEIAAERLAEKAASKARRIGAAKARADKLRAQLAALEGTIAEAEPVAAPRKATPRKAAAKAAAAPSATNVTPLQREPLARRARRAPAKAATANSVVLDDDDVF